jgi:hypothetical protein
MMIPPYGRRHEPVPGTAESFPFAFDRSAGIVLACLGIRPSTSMVVIDTDGAVLDARFGPWHVVTPLSNITAAETGGPYTAWKVVGPRLSLADRGLTFGSTTRAGVCLQFRRPVRGIEPSGLLRHPSLTVTVAEPDAFLARLRSCTAVS